MFNKLKSLIFDRKRSEEEFKTVYQVLSKINDFTYNQDYAVFPWGIRSKNYEELKKLPSIIQDLQRENEVLQQEIRTYKEHVESIDSVINTLIYNIEKRYDTKKHEDEC